MPAVNEPIHAPEFQPGSWLNSPPLSLQALRGSVVLVEFWDYSCSNCLRTLPYMRAWWQRYRDAGLVIIGIHTPEFGFAREEEHVQRAVWDLSLEYPILLDNEHRNWHTWANRYWPARYLVDKNGYISYFHFGEGDYVGFEWNVQLLLRQIHPDAVFPAPMTPLRESDEPGAVCYRCTPELYLGYQRGQIGNAEPLRPNHITEYVYAGEEKLDTAYLHGYWYSGPEAVTLATEQGDIFIRYRGKEVVFVLTPPECAVGRVEVYQDGDNLPGYAVGDDVSYDGNAMVLTVDTPRLYSIVNNPHHGMHSLRFHVCTPGISVYAISFISECVDEIRGEEEAA